MSTAPRLVPPRTAFTPGQMALMAAEMVTLLLVMGAVVWMLRFLLLPVAAAILLSFFTSPMANFLERRGMYRWAAVLLCFTVVLGGLVAGVLALWPLVEGWLKSDPSAQNANGLEAQLLARTSVWQGMAEQAYPHVDWHGLFERAYRFVDGQRKDVVETLPTVALSVLSNLGSLMLAPVLAFFVMVNGQELRRATVAWVPNRYFEIALLLMHRVERQVAAYLRGVAIESTTVALLATGLLSLAGMPGAPVLAAIYGVMNVIPLVGPIIGAGVGLLYGMLDPGAPSLGVLALCYGIVYGIDAAFINPMVIGKNLNLHPLTIILGITVGGNIAGVLGMLLIIPTIATAKAVVLTVRESLAPVSQ